MFSRYKIGEKVIICGIGEFYGTKYENELATIIERDPYYKDYLVKFNNETEDWILPRYIKRQYQTERKVGK